MNATALNQRNAPYLPFPEPPEDPNGIIKKAADDVCRVYDRLALIDRHKLLNNKYVDEFYSVPFVILYERVLDKYVDGLRRGERGLTHFWELTQFYDRVKSVPANHPAYIEGAKEWPKKPRECRPERPTAPP